MTSKHEKMSQINTAETVDFEKNKRKPQTLKSALNAYTTNNQIVSAIFKTFGSWPFNVLVQ